jgi:spermidine synthase
MLAGMNPWPLLDSLPPTRPDAAEEDGQVRAHMKPFVSEDSEGLSLHFTITELQSRMNKSSPWHLDVDYTRTMMGFLLLKPAPARIAMVGLGGGSLAKFCHRQLPGCHMTVVEINPHVIALRSEFCLPDDDERLAVIEGDGAAYMALHTGSFDVLLIDGFDHQGQPAALCSQVFYDDCLAALKTDGVLTVNLHYDDADYPLWVARIQRSFGGNVVEIPAVEKSNCIIFASRGGPLSPHGLSLQAGLSALEPEARKQLKPEFARILWTMKDLSE